MLKVVSPSFSDGGAERVLAEVCNHSMDFNPLSLSSRLDYLREPTKAICFQANPSHGKYARILSVLRFLKSRLDAEDDLLVSSYEVIFYVGFLRFFRLIRYKRLVFRPSIDLDFFYSDLKKRSILLQVLMRCFVGYGVRRSSFLFQSRKIKNSFDDCLSEDSRFSIVPNPVIAPSETTVSSSSVRRILYVGRGTYWKGFDRFLSVSGLIYGLSFEVLGRIDDEYEERISPSIIKHGFVDLKEFDFGEALVLMPSRVEGLPNVLIEMACKGVPVICAKEIEELLDIPTLKAFPEYIDFEAEKQLIADNIENAICLLNPSEILRRRADFVGFAEQKLTISNYVDEIQRLFSNDEERKN